MNIAKITYTTRVGNLLELANCLLCYKRGLDDGMESDRQRAVEASAIINAKLNNWGEPGDYQFYAVDEAIRKMLTAIVYEAPRKDQAFE